MIIIGAGITGLLAGALNPGSLIYEAGPERENHKAVFRCKSPEIGKVLGIPFKEVEVFKSIWLDGKEVQPSPRIAHMYSQKVSGTISSRSITDIRPGKRYIPPADFMDQLRSRCKIEYNTKWNFNKFCIQEKISTVPLDDLAKEMAHSEFNCNYSPIYVSRFKIESCDSYCTIYYPDNKTDIYRASITGDTLIIESTEKISNSELCFVFQSFGIPCCSAEQEGENHKQKFGKIIPIDNDARRQFILEMSLNYNIYSLGRFATWRPKVMLDDVLEDIYVIRRLMSEGKYSAVNHKQNDKG